MTKTNCRYWTVLAPVADFNDVEAAGCGEEQVDWSGSEAPRQEACTLSFAALEITKGLNGVSEGRAVAQPWQGTFPESPFILVLSATTLAAQRAAVEAWFPDVDVPQQPQSFVMLTVRHESSVGCLILGADRVGALYGAYEWLNRTGFRWFGPDPWDTDAPTALPNTLPELNLTVSPSFDIRGFMGLGSPRAHRDLLLWMARNRMNKCGVVDGQEAFCRKCGIRWLGGGHDTFGRYLPAKTYFAEHPEWYGLRGGKRSPNVHEGMGDNICLSNPAARAEVARNAADSLIDGPERSLDILQLWPFDHYDSWCECDACAALGNKVDHLLLLAHDVRQAIRCAMADHRLRRNVQVSICAYHNTLTPPTRPLPADFDHDNIIVQFFVIERCYAHAFDDPRCTEANAKLLNLWQAWASPDCPFRGRMMIGEYYNVSTFAGMAVPFMSVMARDIPFYWKTGARDIDYMHVLAQNWGTHALTNSQFAAMIWNAELDVPVWLNDYFSRRYGVQAEQMTAFYQRLEATLCNAKPLKHYMGVVTDEPPEKLWPLPDYRLASLNRTLPQEGSPEKPVTLFQSQHLSYAAADRTDNDGPSLLETVDGLHEAARMLDQAILDCRDPNVSKRLASDVRRFRYTRLLVLFIYHFVRLRMLESRGDTALALTEAQALRQIGEALRVETLVCRNFVNEAFENGLTATFHSKTYEKIMQQYFPEEMGPATTLVSGKDILPA